MLTSFPRQKGFSLPELMIVLVIVAVLLAIVGPSFRSIIESNRRLFSMERTLAVLTHARSEAVARSSRVHVCPSSDSTTCITGSNIWTTGVIAFVDDGGTSGTAGDGIWQSAGGENIIRILADYGAGISVFGPTAPSTIVFNADGEAVSSGALQICDRNGPTEASAIVIGASGQLRVAVDENASGVVNVGADITCS